ncbi:hypothetical protein O0L34_g19319 [Tuta absoluta]|nr:hypothetical protein O0L34_g19319 [Tuta absoluta]
MPNLYEIRDKEKESITVLGTFTASGKVLPLLIIYPYERIPLEIARNIPQEYCSGKAPKGWMTSRVFYGYIANNLIPYLRKSNVKFPALVLIDGHKSHITYEVSQLCKDNDIILYALHPNATHIIQPADVSVFRPLKNSWRKIVDKWKADTGFRVVTRAQFAPLLKTAMKAVTLEIICHGFRKCGLYPFNADAIDYSKCMGDESRHSTSMKPAEISVEHVLYFESLMSQRRVQEFRAIKPNEPWFGDESAKELFYVWRKIRKNLKEIEGTGKENQVQQHDITPELETSDNPESSSQQQGLGTGEENQAEDHDITAEPETSDDPKSKQTLNTDAENQADQHDITPELVTSDNPESSSQQQGLDTGEENQAEDHTITAEPNTSDDPKSQRTPNTDAGNQADQHDITPELETSDNPKSSSQQQGLGTGEENQAEDHIITAEPNTSDDPKSKRTPNTDAGNQADQHDITPELETFDNPESSSQQQGLGTGEENQAEDHTITAEPETSDDPKSKRTLNTDAQNQADQHDITLELEISNDPSLRQQRTLSPISLNILNNYFEPELLSQEPEEKEVTVPQQNNLPLTPSKAKVTPKEQEPKPGSSKMPVSPAFSNAILWSSESPLKNNGKKKIKQRLPDAIGASKWVKYWNEKKQLKEEKEKKKLARAEKKNTKDKQKSKPTKRKQIKSKIFEESDSDDDNVTLNVYAKGEKKRLSSAKDKILENSEKSEPPKKKRIKTKVVVEPEPEDDVILNVDTQRSKNIEDGLDVDMGSYVIVKYEGEYFPGQIKKIDGHNAEVSTMVLSSATTFKWPEKEDILWYGPESIVEIIKLPVSINNRGSYKVEEMAKFLQWTL